MAAVVARRVRTAPPAPGQALVIDWSNPITRDMTMVVSLADAGYGYMAGGQTVFPLTSGSQSNTPQTTGAKSSANPLFAIGAQGVINSPNYSLFAVGSCTSNSVTQSALDMDNGTTRYFQFRIANGKVDFIPFSTGAAVTGQATSPTALSVSEMSRGFTMGATASPTRTAAFQNGVVTVGSAPSNLVTPGTNMPLNIGARQTNTQAWAAGGLSLVATWTRTLADAEMQSLADNPWQLFKAPPPRRLWLAYSASGGVTTNVTPAPIALALTGYAPAIVQTVTTSVAPGAGSLTLAGYAPTVTQSINTGVAPLPGALTLAGFAPTVTQSASRSVSPGAGAISLTGYAPTVTRTASQAVQPGAGALTLTGYAPMIFQGADNAPRVNVATIMRVTTTNRTADLGAALNATAPIRSAAPNLATIMSAAPTNRAADLGPASINRIVSFP